MNLNDKCILITGGSGFVGSHLARYFLSMGYEVHLLLRQSSSFRYFSEDLAHAVRWDILDVNDITRAVCESNCSTIFHCAANTEIEEDLLSVDRLLEDNFSFGVHLLHAATKSVCKYFINTGTYWQFNSSGFSQPNTLYAALKQSFQAILSYYCNQYKLFATNLILHNVYGDEDKRKKILDLFLSAAQSEQILNLSPGKQILSFVYITDVLKAYELAWLLLKQSESNEVRTYHVYHEKYNLIELAQLFEDIGMKINCNWSSLPYQKNQIMIPYCGSTVPQWEPKEKLINWITRRAVAHARLI